MSSLAATDFAFISALAYRSAALVLEPGKEYLVESRLSPLAEREGFDSLTEFITKLRCGGEARELETKAVDALTTNETYFFRDFHPFDALRRHVLPDLIGRRRAERRLAIWSCACSTGQEAYSLAMLVRDHFAELADWQVEIVGTDYSETVLECARRGEYNQIEVNRGLPAPCLLKHFVQRGNTWAVNEALRRLVAFRRMNLVDPWPAMPPFDLVLLRNVMIYFDVGTKRRILSKVAQQLRADGTLLLGAAETTINLHPGWKPVTYGRTVVYRPAVAGQ